MVIVMVVLTIVVFAVVDVVTRITLRKMEASRITRERQRALDIGLKLDYSMEAPSLKRVEVAAPKARIMAVDDESIILDSFRKILVVAGYSVDTVLTGEEAIGLIQRNEYDFVFTDLKMPGMDGLDVTKAVKHYRPDIDVVMITGYATIESAVDAMKFGTMDYVQKPFTADELVEFANKLLIRRQDRIERERKPKVRLVTPSTGESEGRRTYNVPAGLFVAPEHTWVCLCQDGMLLVGLDDFALKTLGEVDGFELPPEGTRIQKGDPLVRVLRGSRSLTFASPVTGRIATINDRALGDPLRVARKPYEWGWLCGVEPERIGDELRDLRIGAEAVDWYQSEIDRYSAVLKEVGKAVDRGGGDSRDEEPDADDQWEVVSRVLTHA
jgi:CheY-like chemotaxis protein